MQNLNQLKKMVRECKRCPLYREINVFPNIGVGSKNPDILFVLGGVDKDALINDRPFCSRDEEVLLSALTKAQISPSQCYVTSIIKCGTLTNHKKYANICIDWLRHEINELKPKCLFFMSEVAYKMFSKLCPESKIPIFVMSNGLSGIFNKNSLMKDFINRLSEANEFCKKV